MNKKVKTARLSIFSNVFLISIKLIAGLTSGSVSIFSEAIHSTMYLIAAVIAFFSVKISSQPPDKEHPYDHGKFKNISGLIDGFLILLADLWIIYEAIALIKNAYRPLLDTSLPENGIQLIRTRLDKFTGECISFHQLRTRKSGPHKYHDFHLEVPSEMMLRKHISFVTTLQMS